MQRRSRLLSLFSQQRAPLSAAAGFIEVAGAAGLPPED
jgi:hypothetical protein